MNFLNLVQMQIDISLTWRDRTLTEEELAQIMAFPNMVRLNLANLGLNDAFAAIIAQGFERNKPPLKVLNLSSNAFTFRSLQRITHALRGNTTLEKLNLSSNPIGAEGIVYLPDALRDCPLRDLSLCGISFGVGGAQTVARLLRECSTIKRVQLNQNNIKNEGAVVIAGALHNCPNLQRLELVSNNISIPGILALADGLIVTSHTLETLRIGFNSLEDEGTTVLADALGFCSKLKFLDLRGSKIGVGGAHAVAALLGRVCTIEGLSIGMNPLGDEGIEALSRVLRDDNDSSLRELKLEATNIKYEGILALCRALGPDSKLNHLSLRQNPYGRAEILDLAELIESENKIRDLNLNYCGINYEGMEVLVTSLMSRNTRLNTLNLSDNNPGERGNIALDRLRRSERAPRHLWR